MFYSVMNHVSLYGNDHHVINKRAFRRDSVMMNRNLFHHTKCVIVAPGFNFALCWRNSLFLCIAFVEWCGRKLYSDTR